MMVNHNQVSNISQQRFIFDERKLFPFIPLSTTFRANKIHTKHTNANKNPKEVSVNIRMSTKIKHKSTKL